MNAFSCYFYAIMTLSKVSTKAIYMSAKPLTRIQHRKFKMRNTPKKNFVFEGGGAKGIGFVGALNIAQRQGYLKHLEKVAGSSAGGITAFLLAVGYSPNEITKISMDIDLKQVLQDPSTGSNGPFKGEKFIMLARSLLKAKTGRDKISFAQLHELKQRHPKFNIKDLYLTGTDLETGESVVFSHENKETKHVDVIDALRATMSLPQVFEPHEIEINGKKRKFIDGGIKNNYPMDIFDSYDKHGNRIPNPETLGFKVDDKEECQKVLFDKKVKNKAINMGNITALVQDADVQKYYKYNTVQIYDAGVNTLNFGLDDLTKYTLKVSGEQAMKAFIKDGYQKYSMDDNKLVNILMRLSKNLSNNDFIAAYKDLSLLNIKFKNNARDVAPMIIKTLENTNVAGLSRTARQNHHSLLSKTKQIIGIVPKKKPILYKHNANNMIKEPKMVLFIFPLKKVGNKVQKNNPMKISHHTQRLRK